jgi:hypothetical protein
MNAKVFKAVRVMSYIAGAGVLGIGVLLMFTSQTTDEQTVSTLVAIFGLLLVWFIAWTGRKQS